MYVAMCVCVCLHELIKTWPIDMVLKDVGEIYVAVMDVRTLGLKEVIMKTNNNRQVFVNRFVHLLEWPQRSVLLMDPP